MYEYAGRVSLPSKKSKVEPIHDGDTLRLDVDLGFDTWRFRQSFRLLGIQAPELGDPGGKASRDWLRELLPVGTEVRIVTKKDEQEKYGRYLATIYLDDQNICINAVLVSSKHAVEWDGTGPRPSGMTE